MRNFVQKFLQQIKSLKIYVQNHLQKNGSPFPPKTPYRFLIPKVRNLGTKRRPPAVPTVRLFLLIALSPSLFSAYQDRQVHHEYLPSTESLKNLLSERLRAKRAQVKTWPCPVIKGFLWNEDKVRTEQSLLNHATSSVSQHFQTHTHTHNEQSLRSWAQPQEWLDWAKS